MRLHVEATFLPRCPEPECSYELTEEDLLQLCVELKRVDNFNRAKLSMAVDGLAEADEVLVRCSRSECDNAVLLPSTGRQCFTCTSCHAETFCTRCRLVPYHFHVDCSRVELVREQWLSWLQAQDETRALHDRMARNNDLAADELWKADHCRRCPRCMRPVIKDSGCDLMVCGRNYHGGDAQPGCGRAFKWSEARPYQAYVKCIQAPALDKERGRDVFHPFVACNLCDRRGFWGPRFQCLHCRDFDVCRDCAPLLAGCHASNHIFDIMFESDLTTRCPWLPDGTLVRIARSDTSLSSATCGRGVAELEGKVGTIVARSAVSHEFYEVQLEWPLHTRHLDKMFLQPLVYSNSEAEDLVRRIEQWEPSRPAIPLRRAGCCRRRAREKLA